MSFSDSVNYLISNSTKLKDGKSIVPQFEVKYETATIRPLTQNDIEGIVLARRCQEEENKNGANDEYLKQYSEIVKSLFEKDLIIGAGAFKKERLISLAFFNLLSYGKENKLPYLCAVWTNPEYRGKGLATTVNDKLLEGVKERMDRMQGDLLLTIEGGEPAYKLYGKEGYKRKEGEMQFLGDIDAPYFSSETEAIKSDEKHIKRISFTENDVEQMNIEYSEEQLFPHPTNISGKMCRITGISILNSNLRINQFKEYLQYFLSKNRFCKFNINELLEHDYRILEIFGIDEEETSRLGDEFEKIGFTDVNGAQVSIKKNNNTMENTIENALKHSLIGKGDKEKSLY